MLCEVAPLAMAMRDRLQNDPHSFAEEPASVFSAGK
jgi:hypothetical protein